MTVRRRTFSPANELKKHLNNHPPTLTLISGTNRPGSNTRRITTHLEEAYAALRVPVHVLDLATLPPEIFSPTSDGK